MTRRAQFALLLFVGCISTVAQTQGRTFPASITIARETYFDVGPPFDFYEVFTINETGRGLVVERAILAPAGDACFQPPSVEIQSEKLETSMASLLSDKNPCDIPEKALKRESKRCKHCLNFSGSNVTMHVSCKAKDRQIRMNVLEKDWFDANPNTPEHTSWGMSILHDLDSSLGPGVLDKPVFAVSETTKRPARDAQNSPMAEALKSGKYDYLFSSKQSLSLLFDESLRPPRSPIVELIGTAPIAPFELPQYPPIARAAHVSGKIALAFDVTPDGRTQNISITRGPEMFRGAVRYAVEKWRFPESAAEHHEETTFNFNLNCAPIVVSVTNTAQR